MFRFDVVTLFPRMLEAITEWGISGRARARGCYEVVTWNPRDFATGPYRAIDERHDLRGIVAAHFSKIAHALFRDDSAVVLSFSGDDVDDAIPVSPRIHSALF